MLSPTRYNRPKSESIVGDRGVGLLSPKFNDALKRGANISPLQQKNSPPPPKFNKFPECENDDEREDSPKPKTVTVNCGVIKFQDIIIPPSAPTDLICEECELAISVLHCSRCAQVFCMRCAEQCHPKPYGEDYHPHEVDESIRSVQFGDTSRIKPDTSFKMPDTELHEVDYIKIKDLTKPQSLSTSLEVVKPSNQPAQAPKYDVLQVVIYNDPHTEREAYGKIISQWDQRHGTMATPAILRGEKSVVYYVVQQLGFTKDVENIANLIPPTSAVEKIENFPVIEGVEIDQMMAHRKAAHIINKKIAAAEGIKRLGPKHHFRDVVNYGCQKDAILLDNREYGLNGTKGDQLLNSAIYNSNLDDMSECVTMASSTVSQRQLAANKHRKLRMGTNNEYIITPIEFPDNLYDKVDMNLYADIDTDVQSQLSLDNPLSRPYPAHHRSYQHVLHSAACGDHMTINSHEQHSITSQYSHNGLHHHHHHGAGDEDDISTTSNSTGASAAAKNKGTAMQRLLQKHQRALTHSNSVDHQHSLVMSLNQQSTGNSRQHHQLGGLGVGVTDYYTHSALQVIVLSERDMCTVQERISSEVVRRDKLMRKVWDKLSGSEKILMKQHGLRRWQRNVNMIRNNEQHHAAIRIQALIRKFLCKDKLAEKTEEFINRQIKKRDDLHARFRYSDATDSRSVTMDKKIYFKTHLDLNRYAALLRVLMFKLAKYLARKRFALLRHAITRWRSSLVTFVESDIQVSHINEAAVEDEPADPAKRFVSIEHQRDRITQEYLRLQAVAAEVVLTSPQRKFPQQYVDELSHDTVVSLPLRLPVIPQLDGASLMSTKIAAFQEMKSAKLVAAVTMKEKQSVKKTPLLTPSSAATPLTPPASSPSRESNNSRGATADSRGAGVSRGASRDRRRIGGGALLMDDIASLTVDTTATTVTTGSVAATVVGGEGEEGEGERKQEEEDREDVADFEDANEAELALRVAALERAETKGESTTATGEVKGKEGGGLPLADLSLQHQRVPSYFPSDGMNLPPLPQIFIPQTAEGRLNIKNDRRLDNCCFRDKMIGPTYDSNWVIPERLCMGCMPWGAAETSNTDYPIPPDLSHMSASMKSMKNMKNMASVSAKFVVGDTQGMSASAKFGVTYDRSLSTNAMNTSTNATDTQIAAKNKFKTDKWKPPPVTAVSALLLNRVDYFISLMDEEEERAIEQACAVPSVQSCIQNALATANAAVMTIISQCMEIIARQTKRMDDIPRYGKSDPRQPASQREILRCKARIQLATENMNRAKQQVRNLPPHADFIRIPLRIDGLITINELLPKIWQMEEILQQQRTVYVYSRDGHGRAGLVAGILLGRLYNLHPYEALYRLQASHDCAKREARRDMPINCPQLPVQRELLAQILQVTNRPVELTHVRTQLDPETFAEYRPQRSVLCDTGGGVGAAAGSGRSVAGSHLTSHTRPAPSAGAASDGKRKERPPSRFKEFDGKQHGSTLSAQNSFSSALSSGGGSTGGVGGGDAGVGVDSNVSALSTARSSLLRALSWRSHDSQAEEAARRAAAEQAHNEELGNNLDVIEAEKEFLEALFAAQNLRKKQTFGMKVDGPYTWGRNEGITHRGDTTAVESVAPGLSRTMPAEPQLPELFNKYMLGQSVDVARKLPTRRTEPTLRPHLPHIRTAAAPVPLLRAESPGKHCQYL